MNFSDEGRQWFKAEVGLGVRSTPLEASLCGQVILQDDFVEIPDTLSDARMAHNPLCTSEPGFRFYAGSVLKGANGLPLGTLCVLDHKPRTLSEHKRKVLRVLSTHIMRELDFRIALAQEQTLRREVDHRVKNSLASIGSLFTRIESDLRSLIPDGIDVIIGVQGKRATHQLANAFVLFVNEFVSNSVKHAFGSGSGSISIMIELHENGWIITCKDDGCAAMEDAQRAASDSGLGTRVTQSLASSMSTKPEWSSDGSGMNLKIEFPSY